MAFPRKRVIGGLIAGGVLTVGLAVPAVASADPSPSPSSGAHAEADRDGRPLLRHQKFRGEHAEKLAEALAEKLGVPREKVEDALRKIAEKRRAELPKRTKRSAGPGVAERKAERRAALSDRLDAAVEEGKLTREQADAVLKAFDEGVLPRLGAPHRRVAPDAKTTPESGN